MKETTENHSQESCEVDAGDGALTVSPEETICFTTTRFGDQEAPVDMIVEFPDGLLGFPDCRRFIIVQNPSGGPFQWLQSIDEPGLAFVVAEPMEFFENYDVPAKAAELESIGLSVIDDAVVLVLLVVPSDPTLITANLQGPIVINPEARLGKQLVLQVPEYTTSRPIFPPRQEQEEEEQLVGETGAKRPAGC